MHTGERSENFDSLNIDENILKYGQKYKIDGISKIRCFKCNEFADIHRNLSLITVFCSKCKNVHQMQPEDGIIYIRRKIKMNQKTFKIKPGSQELETIISFAINLRKRHTEITYHEFITMMKTAFKDIDYEDIINYLNPIYYGDELVPKSQSQNVTKN